MAVAEKLKTERNKDPTKQDTKVTITVPTSGYVTSGYMFSIRIQVKQADEPIIVPFPKIIIIAPTTDAEENLPACLKTRQNPSQAAEQKFELLRAI